MMRRLHIAFALLGIFDTNLFPSGSLYAKASPVASIDQHESPTPVRVRTRLNDGWRFRHFDTIPDNVVYDVRPDADGDELKVLKPWILPAGNDFIKDPNDRFKAPGNEPDIDVEYVRDDFDDGEWDLVSLPHDWAIEGPFYESDDSAGSTDMGSLPVGGVGWYRRRLEVPLDGTRRESVYLEIDGAMSYPMVWLNGHLIGGWPYGYNSFRVDLTPHLNQNSEENRLAIRVENPTEDFSRWYPGAGIYRNVWLTRTSPTHISHWGTFVTTDKVLDDEAVLSLTVQVENEANRSRHVRVETDVHEFPPEARGPTGKAVARFPRRKLDLSAKEKIPVVGSTIVKSPRLWGPPPSQTPNLYTAITRLFDEGSGELLDTYETRFGIRSLDFDPNEGLHVNGKHVRIQGVNMHHDLGALGAAFNVRAAQRQLETLQEVGVNAIRMSHNPPAPELLDLADEMGFLVVNEIFDTWEEGKKICDFHLIFDEWKEQDLRAFLRRDRNHPSVIVWSVGNEVVEQNVEDEIAAKMATYLKNIVREEDQTRPVMSSMNSAWPDQQLPKALDLIALNYQGEGLRYGPAYEHLEGNRRPPQAEPFHKAHPDKLIFGSEIAWSLSSRDKFLFPVCGYDSCPVNDTSGGDSESFEISAYELYSADAGSSPDKVFRMHERYPFVAGGFVWAGWDYLGEPYPYYDGARSAYSGIFDLAGFKKERFYQYQAYWRPDHRMAHIVPHWTWPSDRVGKLTPVHVFSSADEAELFLNGKSLGKLKKEPEAHRFRWDNVTYEPGALRVVTHKDGRFWATDSVHTVGKATRLKLETDRTSITADGDDLSFVTVSVVDSKGDMVPNADDLLKFTVKSGPGKIVATDNGLQTDLTSFTSRERRAYNGLALCIVRGLPGQSGNIVLKVEGDGLGGAEITIKARNARK